MDKTEMITLEKPKLVQNALKHFVQEGVQQRKIFCSVQNVKRSEWAAAAHKDLKAMYCVTIWADEYQGETVAVLNGVRYGIYRTYQPNAEEMELYLEQKTGV